VGAAGSVSSLEPIHTTGNGAFIITDCDIITDYYSLASPAQVSAISEKVQGASDSITYLNPIVHSMTYSINSDVMVGSQKNLESCWVMQGTAGHGNSTSASYYNGSGHLMLLNLNAHVATTHIAKTQNDATDGAPLSSIQCQYGEIMFPPYTLETANGAISDLSSAYNEYCKLLNVIGSHAIKPIPFHVYSRILPFIALRPWSSHGQHLTQEGKDLIVKLRMCSTSAITTTAINIICFRLQVCQIAPDGTVSINY